MLTALYYNTPVKWGGIDYNADGQLDERWMYVGDHISITKVGRSLDGKVDLIFHFDRKGLTESSESDEDFSVVFETETYFDYGNSK